MEKWEVRRAFDIYSYRLFERAQKKGEPFLSVEETRDCLDKLGYPFPKEVKLQDILFALEKRGYVKRFPYNKKDGFGRKDDISPLERIDMPIEKIEKVCIQACPYIPLKALEEGHEQRKWFQK